MTKYTSDGSNFGAGGPFFRIIREGLEGLADGEDYFDLLADDVVFEYVISVPGYPNGIACHPGRALRTNKIAALQAMAMQ